MRVRQVFSILTLCIALRQVVGLWILFGTYMMLVATCFLGSVSLKQKNRHIRRFLKLTGAGDGTRTRDTLLGRQELYH